MIKLEINYHTVTFNTPTKHNDDCYFRYSATGVDSNGIKYYAMWETQESFKNQQELDYLLSLSNVGSAILNRIAKLKTMELSNIPCNWKNPVRYGEEQ